MPFERRLILIDCRARRRRRFLDALVVALAFAAAAIFAIATWHFSH